MKFDKEKVLTPFTAHKVSKGDIGWVGADLAEIYHMSKRKENLCVLTDINYNLDMIREKWTFYSNKRNGHYFYPAPYELAQEKWVEENNLKVGDKVRVTRRWKNNEAGSAAFLGRTSVVGNVYAVQAIQGNYIDLYFISGGWVCDAPYFAIEKILEPTYEERQAEWVKKNNLKVGDKVKIVKGWEEGEMGFAKGQMRVIGSEFSVVEIDKSEIWGCPNPLYFDLVPTQALPYFAIEKVTEEHRQFANAEEFAPYRDDWFRYRDTEELARVTEYNDNGLTIGGQEIDYKHFFDAFSNDTKGIPAGVEV